LINQARGLLAEYGIVLSKGPARLAAEGPGAVAAAPLSDLARELFTTLFDQLQELETRVEALDARLVAICREDAASRRLATLPGVGPVIASALVASINDGRHFRNGRELAAPRRPPGRRPCRNGSIAAAIDGSGSYHANVRREASLGSTASAVRPTIIYAAR
jgi:transposase